MTAPLPPYQPSSPAWLAGYEHAKRQAAELADNAAKSEEAGREKWKDRPGGIPHDWIEHWVTGDETAEDIRDAIAAMRPSPPRYSPGCEPTTLHQRVAAQESGGKDNALYGQKTGQ